MCGVAGYFGKNVIPEEQLKAALGTMRRRGPDAAAVQHWRRNTTHTYLLHSRLNIIDLDDRANQPFHLAPLWMAYNGELYNYVELRDQLAAEGLSFHTTSDTEVLLAAIRHWGWKAIDRCEGMWAFAVYNEETGALSLCRDRFGEKPLYMYNDASGTYFGSEVKAIAALLDSPLEINPSHLLRYMVNGYKALYKSGETFYKNLYELPRASRLDLTPGTTPTTQVYWKPSYTPDVGMTREAAIMGVRDRLSRAVQLRLRADVPLAFCMSGGIDSNALISLAKRVHGYDVHGFTIQNTDARYEEQAMVDHAVHELGIRHTTVPVTTADFIPKLRNLIAYHDGPIATISYFAHWKLMQKISEAGYRISISGTAADELFTGYYDHHLMYLAHLHGDTAAHAPAVATWRAHVQSVVRNPFLQDPDRFVREPGCRDHIFLNADVFSEYTRSGWCELFAETEFVPDLLRNRMFNELFHEVVPVILHEDDLNAMYFSIENRSPFLDRSLFDFCSRIPTRHLIHNGHTKSVLRDALEGVLPEAIRCNRRKVGFNVPLFDYLDVRNPNTRSYLLDDSPIFELVKREAITALLDKPTLPNSESKFLFNFLNAKLFLEQHATNHCSH